MNVLTDCIRTGAAVSVQILIGTLTFSGVELGPVLTRAQKFTRYVDYFPILYLCLLLTPPPPMHTPGHLSGL